MMSFLITDRTDFPIMRRNTSPMPTGRTPGADSICPERARSAGSRTALAPLQFRKMGCQNERKKLAQIRYQVTCYGIKLESGDLPRFFMIDEIDHARLEKKKVVRLRLSVSESSCGRSGFSEVVFLRSFFGLELRMRMLKRHEGCHFFVWRGGLAHGRLNSTWRLRSTGQRTFSPLSSSSQRPKLERS